MKTRTLLPLGTRWDGSAERLPEKAARRSAASRGQGSLPPAPAGHIPPRRRAILAGRRRAPPQGKPRTAAAAVLATRSPAAAMRTLRPGPAALLPRRRRGWGWSRRPAPERGGQRGGGEQPAAPSPGRKFAAERCRARGRRWRRRDGGPTAAAWPPPLPGPPQRRSAAAESSGRPGEPPGRRVFSGSPSAQEGLRCPKQGRLRARLRAPSLPRSVSQPRGRIFIGKALPAHPWGSEEFRALLVSWSVIAGTGVPPAQIQKRDALAAFFFLSFYLSFFF